MKSIIITGATSMIGAAIVKEALEQGKKVAAVVRKNSPKMENLCKSSDNRNLKIIECDIQDYKTISFDGQYDAFLYAAWQSTDPASRDDVYTQTNNIIYTIDAVHVAHRAGCKVFVCAGSQAEYGRIPAELSGDTPCNPESGYGIAKYAAGKMARLVAGQLGMRCCHARILSTYGEGMGDGTLIIYLIKKLLAGETPSLTKCVQVWDFLYVKDTARAMLAIAEKGVDGKAYPVGSGSAKPLCEYIEAIRDIVNPSIELRYGEKEYYPHQPMYLCADISELQSDTGFKPAISFEDGIRRTIKWVKEKDKMV